METPSFVVGLIQKDGLVLAVSRRNQPTNLGLPGGSIESFDENPYAALVREVKEETNVDVMLAHHVFSRIDETTNKKVAWCYQITEWSGEPQQTEEGITVQWVKPERLLEEGCTFREYNKRLFISLGVL
jgi:8-oxo-dGTP pyrophosphatase MutT (NUDIX family)